MTERRKRRLMKQLEIDTIYKELDERVSFIESLIQIGIDLSPVGGSWAVVCINGKSEYVNFINLENEDAQYIKSLFSGISIKNKTVDSPYSRMAW